MAAQNLCRDALTWRDGASDPEALFMCSVPRHRQWSQATDRRTDGFEPLSEEDWHLLFDAVKSRLTAAAASPATAAAVVPECVEALDWLQGMLKTKARRSR